MALAYFASEWNTFAKCYSARRAADPTAAASIARPVQILMDGMSCADNNAFALSFFLMVTVALVCYVASTVTNDYSMVDRIWSIFPVPCAWIHASVAANTAGAPLGDGEINARRMFAWCVTLWGIRMTYNFWRRDNGIHYRLGWDKAGKWVGKEDYRWVEVRKMPMLQNRLVWELFALGFVSLFQIALLWAQTLPILAIPAGAKATGTHFVIAAIFLGFLFFETWADEEQWCFQESKYGKAPKMRRYVHDYKRGFCTQGPFRVSRKPNVFSEQMMWVTIYLLSITQGWGWLNVSVAGAAALVGLTIRSSFFTEQITGSKYPAYADYQMQVSMLIPCFAWGARYAAEGAEKSKSPSRK